MTDWKPRSKYEVAPGLFIGSEISDIDREHRQLLKRYLDGDESVRPRMIELQNRRMDLLMPKVLRDVRKG